MNTIPNQFSSKVLLDLGIADLPCGANVHSALALSLGESHLASNNELSGVKSGLIEISVVLLSYCGADARTSISIFGSSKGTYSINGRDDLAHVLALVQISSLEDVSVLQSECLATLDELFDVLHLFESHLLCVNPLDKGLSIKSVQQLAENCSVLKTGLEVVHSNFLVAEGFSEYLFDPCSALLFLFQIVLSFKLFLDVSGET